MSDQPTPPPTGPATADEPRKKSSRVTCLVVGCLALLLLGALLLIGAFVLFGYATRKVKVEEIGGERFEYPAFYHADGDEWILNEPRVAVLKEMKFVSSDIEEKHYLVVATKPGTRVRIVEAHQRWKLVEVLDADGKDTATGWIDANGVRQVVPAPTPE